MIKKLYSCQMEGCSRTTPFRNIIKAGPHKNKKVCPSCYSKNSKGLSRRVNEKRSKERSGLPEFFKKHIAKITTCENCGLVIQNPDAKNVAHILPKEVFKSVMTEDLNTMYLCSSLDRPDNKVGCHDLYDHSWGSAMTMKIWKTALERFKQFESKVKENSIILLNFIKNA